MPTLPKLPTLPTLGSWWPGGLAMRGFTTVGKLGNVGNGQASE
jgi:hypothetical protein